MSGRGVQVRPSQISFPADKLTYLQAVETQLERKRQGVYLRSFGLANQRLLAVCQLGYRGLLSQTKVSGVIVRRDAHIDLRQARFLLYCKRAPPLHSRSKCCNSILRVRLITTV